MVTLKRHLRSGRTVETPGLTLADAQKFAAMMLADNGVASEAEAKKWAATLPMGKRVDHPSGYGATIEP